MVRIELLRRVDRGEKRAEDAVHQTGCHHSQPRYGERCDEQVTTVRENPFHCQRRSTTAAMVGERTAAVQVKTLACRDDWVIPTTCFDLL